MQSQYPKVGLGKRFLNSGGMCVFDVYFTQFKLLVFPLGFMGYAKEVYALMSHHEVKDTDDDQLYFTKLFLALRVSFFSYHVSSPYSRRSMLL